MNQKHDGPWLVAFFKRGETETAPALGFLDRIPEDAESEIVSTLDAVAKGPPPSFRGGLRYQRMRREMSDFHEVRTKSQKRLYRLFVIEDREAPGLPKPTLALIAGGVKDVLSAFTPSFYEEVRALGDEYLSHNPRSVLE